MVPGSAITPLTEALLVVLGVSDTQASHTQYKGMSEVAFCHL
jgi:hypothetical protein